VLAKIERKAAWIAMSMGRPQKLIFKPIRPPVAS
jgi:hypothetical protein